MSVGLLAYLWQLQFVFPAVVSAGLLAKLWRDRHLFGVSGTIFCGWFAVAALAQFLWAAGVIRLIGLLAQVALAIVLVLKNQLHGRETS